MADEVESPKTSQRDPDPEGAAGESVNVRRWRPWITWGCFLVFGVVYLVLSMHPNPGSPEAAARVGLLPPYLIWSGAYWALLTPMLVHVGAGHLAMSLWFWWVVGPRLEYAIGHGWFLGFIVISAFVCGAAELAITDMNGVGSSSVVFSMVGFMWMTRRRYRVVGALMTPRFFGILLAILLGFGVIEWLGMMKFAFMGSAVGLLFGGVAGAGIGGQLRRPLAGSLAVMVVVGSTVPLFYCPWSNTWLSVKAHAAAESGDYVGAVGYLNVILEKDPEFAAAYRNRGMVYEMLGEQEKADVDYEKAKTLDAELSDSK